MFETLVALAILGFIAPALSMSIYQVLNINELAGNHMTVIKQAESAMHWLSGDALMAQTVQTGGSSGFPLDLAWVDWENVSNNVTYTLMDGELQRVHSINGTTVSSSVVAWHIDSDPEDTSCNYTDGTLTFKITSSIGGFRPVSEERVGKIIPKSQ